MARIQDGNLNPIFDDVIASATIAALDDVVALQLHGQGAAAFQFTNPVGPPTFDVAFEGSVDGVNWQTFTAINGEDGQPFGEDACPLAGIFFVACGGLEWVRVRVSAYTSGSCDVAAKAGYGAGTVSLTPYGGGGGGGGTVDQGAAAADSSDPWPVMVSQGGNDAEVVNADPAGTEYGLVTRNIPSGTQPVSAASLPLPTGAATSALQTQPGVDIGDVTVNNAAGTNPVPVQGNVAHDAAVAGNPVLLAGRANTNEPATPVADGDATHLWADLLGRLVVIAGHPNPADPVTLNATASGDTTVIAAPGVGQRIHVCKASVHNRAGSARVVSLTDGAGGTVRWRAEIGSNGGGSLIDFGDHGWALTANTALVVNLDAAGDVDVNITEYYVAP
jgi:hypothetical protein